MANSTLGGLAQSVPAGRIALRERAAAPNPGHRDIGHWLDVILPPAAELAWEGAGWRPSLWGAVIEAHRRDKPILLWAMNGHPLACV